MKSERCSHFPGYRKTSGQTAACAEGKTDAARQHRGNLGCGFFSLPYPMGTMPFRALGRRDFALCGRCPLLRRLLQKAGINLWSVAFFHFIFSTGWRSAVEASAAKARKDLSPPGFAKTSLKPNTAGCSFLGPSCRAFWGRFYRPLFLDGRAGQPLAAQVIQRHLMEF